MATCILCGSTFDHPTGREHGHASATFEFACACGKCRVWRPTLAPVVALPATCGSILPATAATMRARRIVQPVPAVARTLVIAALALIDLAAWSAALLAMVRA
jgi:hypothetical protein